MIRIRTTKIGDKVRYELMDGDVKIRDVTRNEILEMIRQFAGSLRYEPD